MTGIGIYILLLGRRLVPFSIAEFLLYWAGSLRFQIPDDVTPVTAVLLLWNGGRYVPVFSGSETLFRFFLYIYAGNVVPPENLPFIMRIYKCNIVKNNDLRKYI